MTRDIKAALPSWCLQRQRRMLVRRVEGVDLGRRREGEGRRGEDGEQLWVGARGQREPEIAEGVGEGEVQLIIVRCGGEDVGKARGEERSECGEIEVPFEGEGNGA